MRVINTRLIKIIVNVLAIACLVVCVWMLLYTFLSSRDTGTLYIKSSNKSAGLVISQTNKQAILVGTGSVKIRLKPGVYQVSAIQNGKQSNIIARVIKQHTTNVVLGPIRSYMLPSAQTINFKNMDTLINNGLTTEQISTLEENLFQFKHTAQIVTVEPNSVEPAAHNPNLDTGWTINFDVLVDSVSYKATVQFSGLEDLQLSLYNQQGSLVFQNSN